MRAIRLLPGQVRKRHQLALVLGGVVTAGTLWLAMRDADLSMVWTLFLASDWGYAPLLLLSFALSFFVRFFRWKLLLSPICHCQMGQLIGPTMLGFFANNVLPARLGELVRMHIGARKLGLRNSQVLATLMIERLFDLLGALMILWIAVSLSDALSEGLIQIGNLLGFGALLMLALLVIFVRRPSYFTTIGEGVGRLLPKQIEPMIRTQMALFAEGLGVLRHNGLLLGILASSLLVWLLIGGTIYLGLQATDVAVPFSAAFVVLLATLLAVALPTAPGFFGAIQLAYTVALSPYGIDASDAIAASLVYHLLTYLLVTGWGAYYLFKWDYSLRRLEDETG